jgi:hypothetical protein
MTTHMEEKTLRPQKGPSIEIKDKCNRALSKTQSTIAKTIDGLHQRVIGLENYQDELEHGPLGQVASYERHLQDEHVQRAKVLPSPVPYLTGSLSLTVRTSKVRQLGGTFITPLITLKFPVFRPLTSSAS